MKIIRVLCGPFFVFAGAMHFARPKWYLSIMPPWLPAPEALNYASGAAEVLGGAALICPDKRVRRAGGWFTIATLLAVFPANVHMALNPDDYSKVPPAGLYARLPFQALFIAWVAAAMKPANRQTGS